MLSVVEQISFVAVTAAASNFTRVSTYERTTEPVIFVFFAEDFHHVLRRYDWGFHPSFQSMRFFASSIVLKPPVVA